MAEIGRGPVLPGDDLSSDEGRLLDALGRIERDRKGHFAIAIHFSRLRAQYREPPFMRIAGRALDGLTLNRGATRYPFATGDIVLLCREVSVDEIDATLTRLRKLFAEDPVVYATEGSRFVTWYDLARSEDHADFKSRVEQAVIEAKRRRQRERAQPAKPVSEPLDPSKLGPLARRLQQIPMADLIRRQSAVEVQPGAKGDVVFREHYVAMPELRRRVAPTIDLFADPWLLQYVLEIVDRRVLTTLGQLNFDGLRQPISLNLNVASLRTPAFLSFHERARAHASKIVIEIQPIDIFSDLTPFIEARDWLKAQGYRVLIDGLTPMTLRYFDPGFLAPDFIKIGWEPEYAGELPKDRLREARSIIEAAGKGAAILTRVDSEDAVRWGFALGIRRFQGRFVDRILDAMVAKGIN